MKKQGIYSHKKSRKLLNPVRDVMRVKHYSIRTERSYIGWIKRFILFHEKRHPTDMADKLDSMGDIGMFPLLIPAGAGVNRDFKKQNNLQYDFFNI